MKLKVLLIMLLVAALSAGVAVANLPPSQPTSVYIKNKQWQNVMDYGASNDSTNGARTIQAFHQALAAAGDSGTVFVPDGDYLLDSTFTVDVDGANIVLATNAYLYFDIEAQSPILNGVEITGDSVTWEGGNIIGNADTAALVVNNQARGNLMKIIGNYNRVRDLKVRRGEYGIRIMGLGASVPVGNIVERCESRYNQRDNFIITLPADSNLITKCVSYQAGYIDYGVDTVLGSWNPNSGDVGSGVAVRGFDFSAAGGFYNVIHDNDIFACRGHGVILWHQDDTTELALYTQITSNRIRDVRYHGITAARALNSTIQHNLIWNTNRPNNWLGNIYQAATFNNSAINIELSSHNTLVAGNVGWDEKTYDTATNDQAIMFSGIVAGDGAPKTDSLTESTDEPSPDYLIVVGNTFYNTKRYQLAMIDSSSGADFFTHREIDGYVVNGIGGTDTLWRTDNPLYRDGRDNMAIDTFARATAYIAGNSWGGVAPLNMIGAYPVTLAASDSGKILKAHVASVFNRWYTFATDQTAAPGAGLDSATVNSLIGDTATVLWAQLLDTTEAVGLINTLVTDSLDEYLLLAGGTMSGNIAMGDNDITGIDQLTGTTNIEVRANSSGGHVILTPGAGTGAVQLWDNSNLYWTWNNNRMEQYTGGGSGGFIRSDTGQFPVQLVTPAGTITADADIASEAEVATIIDGTTTLDSSNIAGGGISNSDMYLTNGYIYVGNGSNIAAMVDTNGLFGGGSGITKAQAADTAEIVTDSILSAGDQEVDFQKTTTDSLNVTDSAFFGGDITFGGDVTLDDIHWTFDWMSCDTCTIGGVSYPRTNGTDGQVLTSDGAGGADWEDVAAGADGQNADSIQDFPVSTTDPTNGQVLTYNSGSGEWEPDDPTGGSGDSSWVEISVDTINPNNNSDIVIGGGGAVAVFDSVIQAIWGLAIGDYTNADSAANHSLDSLTMDSLLNGLGRFGGGASAVTEPYGPMYPGFYDVDVTTATATRATDSITFDSTEGTGSHALHPDVHYTYQGWPNISDGSDTVWTRSNLWMVQSPFGTGTDEDPALFFAVGPEDWRRPFKVDTSSSDTVWSPLSLTDFSGTVSDPSFGVGPGDTGYVFWRTTTGNTTTGQERLYYHWSVDGVTFPQNTDSAIFEPGGDTTSAGVANLLLLSPSWLYEHKQWTMYCIDLGQGRDGFVRRRMEGLGEFDRFNYDVCTFTNLPDTSATGYRFWQARVSKGLAGYWMVMTLDSLGDATTFRNILAHSYDGLAWTFDDDLLPLASEGDAAWDSTYVYTGDVVEGWNADGLILHYWYTGRREAASQWNIGYTLIKFDGDTSNYADSAGFALDVDPSGTQIASALSGKADASHNHAGEDITSGTVADARIASTIARDAEITYETLNSNGDVGTGAGQLAIGDHNHDATYETITNVAKIGDDTANFKTAYGWGDHSTQNYLDNDDANVDTSQWRIAYDSSQNDFLRSNEQASDVDTTGTDIAAALGARPDTAWVDSAATAKATDVATNSPFFVGDATTTEDFVRYQHRKTLDIDSLWFNIADDTPFVQNRMKIALPPEMWSYSGQDEDSNLVHLNITVDPSKRWGYEYIVGLNGIIPTAQEDPAIMVTHDIFGVKAGTDSLHRWRWNFSSDSSTYDSLLNPITGTHINDSDGTLGYARVPLLRHQGAWPTFAYSGPGGIGRVDSCFEMALNPDTALALTADPDQIIWKDSSFVVMTYMTITDNHCGGHWQYTHWFTATSKDMINWNGPYQVHASLDSTLYSNYAPSNVSPSMWVSNGGKLRVLTPAVVDSGGGNPFRIGLLYESDGPTDSMSLIDTVHWTNGPLGAVDSLMPHHLKVRRYSSSQLIMIANCAPNGASTPGSLYVAESFDDGHTWRWREDALIANQRLGSFTNPPGYTGNVTYGSYRSDFFFKEVDGKTRLVLFENQIATVGDFKYFCDLLVSQDKPKPLRFELTDYFIDSDAHNTDSTDSVYAWLGDVDDGETYAFACSTSMGDDSLRFFVSGTAPYTMLVDSFGFNVKIQQAGTDPGNAAEVDSTRPYAIWAAVPGQTPSTNGGNMPVFSGGDTTILYLADAVGSAISSVFDTVAYPGTPRWSPSDGYAITGVRSGPTVIWQGENIVVRFDIQLRQDEGAFRIDDVHFWGTEYKGGAR